MRTLGAFASNNRVMLWSRGYHEVATVDEKAWRKWC